MPTPFGVNSLLQFLITYLLIPQLSDYKNLKVDIHPICLFLYFSQPIGIYSFKGSTYYTWTLLTFVLAEQIRVSTRISH